MIDPTYVTVLGVPGEFRFRIDFPFDPATAPDPWAAAHHAEAWLTEHGFVLGDMERDQPRGIMPAEHYYGVSKWRLLTDRDRRDLAGVMVGGNRSHPDATVYLRVAPDAGEGKKA
jgi:hypothetical protein